MNTASRNIKTTKSASKTVAVFEMALETFLFMKTSLNNFRLSIRIKKRTNNLKKIIIPVG
jgi:hypothetical protein